MTMRVDGRLSEPSKGVTRTVTTVTLSLLLLAFWVLMHHYEGLEHDARLYAFQALSRLQPNLAVDLYLQNASQDRFTVFSPFYAFAIGCMGLENAALVLTVIFTVWFLAATWSIACRVGGYPLAWASTALLILIPGDYGALKVFHFPEAYLSARLPAYAFEATAIALHMTDHKRLSLCLAAAALLVHPIMAFPGVLLLLCLTCSIRSSLIVVSTGVLSACGIALSAVALPSVAHVVTVIDPPWLEVVRERSAFLFLQLWNIRDWELNARPFLSLAITATVLRQPRERRLCGGSLLVGAAGILIAFVGGKVGPIALLVQGQAWRWEWVTCLVAVLLLPQTVCRIWNDERCGPLCAILLIASWTFPAFDGTLCASMALLLWLVRSRITQLTGRHLRWAAIVLASMLFAWVAATSWNLLQSPPAVSGLEPTALTKLRNVLGLGASATALFGLIWFWVITRRSLRPLIVCASLLVAGLSYALPHSFEQVDPPVSEAYLADFADWRAAIPATSTVTVAPAQDAGKFVWFLLQRPNYLSLDQSAGVVFSRATALEVKRRSDVLSPIETPNWKFLSPASQSTGPNTGAGHIRILTKENLISVCDDPKLGFIVSMIVAGVEPLRRMNHGKWRGWNLYDCQRLRAQPPDAE